VLGEYFEKMMAPQLNKLSTFNIVRTFPLIFTAYETSLTERLSYNCNYNCKLQKSLPLAVLSVCTFSSHHGSGYEKVVQDGSNKWP
jgi:hypothetical protein